MAQTVFRFLRLFDRFLAKMDKDIIASKKYLDNLVINLLNVRNSVI